MTFLNPLGLLGLAAIGLPVAIHLLSKARVRPIRWAAMRFLQASIQKNRRRRQIEDLLLLLVRCLLIALVALIFARPASLTHSVLSVARGATTAVIVLDDSASMGQSDGTQSRFDQARGLVDTILGQLGAGSSCALYLVSDRPRALIAKPTRDFSIIRHTLATATPTDGGSNLLPGLQAAVDALKAAGVRTGDVYVLTDSQKAAWRELGAMRALVESHGAISFHFQGVGTHGEDNLGVSGLEAAGALPAINQPIRCAVKVSNWSHAAALQVPVKLSIDGDPPQDEGTIARIDPGGTGLVTLTARFREPGYHSITASIPGDRLAADNQRSIGLFVLEQIRILLIEGDRSADPVSADGFYLRNALQPVRPDQLEAYPVKVKVGTPGDLEGSPLDPYEAVYLANVARLTPVGAQNLRQYVNQGGALIVFPGPNTDADFYDHDANFSALLPAVLGHDAGPPADRPTLGWQAENYEHPITQLWNEPTSGNLSTVQVTRYFPLTLKPAADGGDSPARVVVKYSDGEPAVVEQPEGKGHVFLFSSTANTTWTTLPLQPAFVPLLIRLTSYVTRGLGGRLDLAVGEPFSIEVDPNDANREFSVTPPGGERHSAGTIEQNGDAVMLSYAKTDRAGPYRVYIGDDPKPRAVFAVQGDPAESDLTQEAAGDLQALQSEHAADGSSDADEQKNRPWVPGREWWPALAIGALVLCLGESWLAHLASQSK